MQAQPFLCALCWTHPTRYSLQQRGLASALERWGVLTATGGTALVIMAVRVILTNPKYCGQGRTLLWQTKYEARTRSRYQHCTRRAAYPRPDDLPEAMAR